jgi:hypothetical protein
MRSREKFMNLQGNSQESLVSAHSLLGGADEQASVVDNNARFHPFYPLSDLLDSRV